MKRQKGMTMPTILVILMVAAFFLNAALKLVPLYIESWTLKTALVNAVESEDGFGSPRAVRSAIAKNLGINQVEVVNAKDIIVQRKDDRTWLVDATYEKRTPLIANIDVVVKFENLTFEVPVK